MYKEKMIDFKILMQIIAKYKKMNLTILFLCITSSMIISFFLMPKMYESKSIIRIEAQTPEGILYDRIQKSMNNLGYKENIPASSLFNYTELIKLCLRTNILSNDMDEERKNQMQKVEIVNIKGTDLYAITVKSNSPDEAQKVLENSLARIDLLLFRLNIENNFEMIQLFDKIIKKKKENLNLYKVNLEEFLLSKKEKISDQARKFLFNIEVFDEDICSINVQKEVSNLQLGHINMKLKEKYFDFKEFNFEKTEKLEKIFNELVKKQIYLLELRQTSLYKDSEVNSLKNEVQTLNYKLNDETKKLFMREESQYSQIFLIYYKKKFLEYSSEINEVLLNTIDQIKKNKEGEFYNLPKDDQEYVELQRNVNNAEKVFSMLYTKCEISKTQGQLNIQIIDPPNLPIDPIGPRKFLIIVVGVIIGGGFNIFLSIARDKHKKI